jgi:hypothetical protein
MFNINFDKLINNNLDAFVRQPKTVNRLKVAIKPVKDLYNEYVALRNQKILEANATGQVIYLEKLLNDKFDPTGTGIYIDSNLAPNPFYLYQKAEAVPPVYVYNKWDATATYFPDYRAVVGTSVYKSLTINVGSNPVINPTNWVFEKEILYLRQKSEFLTNFNFIVWVPVAVTFSTNEMKALINKYKIAGKTYLIKTY